MKTALKEPDLPDWKLLLERLLKEKDITEHIANLFEIVIPREIERAEARGRKCKSCKQDRGYECNNCERLWQT